MKSTEAGLHYFESTEEASRALSLEVIKEARRAVARYGDFRFVLSGGSTPGRLYEMLSAEAKNPEIPWQEFHLFWGDERFLPPHDRNSNYYMAAKKFLNKVPLDANKIHRVPVHLATVREAAQRYNELLKQFEGGDRPLFDLTLLGMGEDGHTASIFPGHPVLNEMTKFAVAVEESAGVPPVPRITMTIGGLANSSRICFLIVGRRKREIMEKIRDGGYEDIYPSARIRGLDRLDWFAAMKETLD